MASPRVVVTGVGVVSAAGLGIEPTWRLLRTRPPRATRFRPPEPADGLAFPAFQTEEYDLREVGVPERCVRWIESEGLAGARDLRHLLASTALALADAGLDADCGSHDPPVSVIVANESPGFEQLSQTLFEAGRTRPFPDDPVARYRGLVDEFFQLNTFLLPYYVARAFGMAGTSLFVNSACTSGLNALDVAAQQIRSGRSRIAVTAAADNPLSAAKFLWFRDLGMYADDGVVRPFDPSQRGTVFGDGGASVVLEEAESARRRNATVYAEVLGFGFAQDGWKVTAPSPVLGRARQALESSLRESAVAPEAVDLVVPHGVGTGTSDQYEARALHEVFGNGGSWPLVTTFKPYVGHNLGGSALLETGLLLAAMARGQVPPTPGSGQPLPRHPVPLVREWTDRRIRRAVKLTCGFAGYYGAAVFGSAPGAGEARQPTGGSVP